MLSDEEILKDLNKSLENGGLHPEKLAKLLSANGFIIQGKEIEKILSGKKLLTNDFLLACKTVLNRNNKCFDETSYVREKIAKIGLGNNELARLINSYNIGSPITANMISKSLHGYRKPSANLIIGLDLILKSDTPQMGDPNAVVNILIEEAVLCGSGGFIYDVKEEVVTIPSDEYQKGLKAYLASGYNMRPEISDFDYLLANPFLEPKSGDLVVYKYNGLKACKVYIKRDDKIILKPFIISNDFNILALDTSVQIEFETVIKIIKKPLYSSFERLKAVFENY